MIGGLVGGSDVIGALGGVLLGGVASVVFGAMLGVVVGALVGVPMERLSRHAPLLLRRWLLLAVAASASIVVAVLAFGTPVAELLEFAPGRTATGLRVGCLVAPIASWLLLVWHVTVPSTPDP